MLARETSTGLKARENRLRDTAKRQGLFLHKTRIRDVRAIGYGTYQLSDLKTGVLVYGDPEWGYGRTLDQIEDYLTGER